VAHLERASETLTLKTPLTQVLSSQTQTFCHFCRAASALTFYGGATFHTDSTDTRDYVLLVAANTTSNVRNVTGTLSLAESIITQVSPSDGQDLRDVINSLNDAANEVDSQVDANRNAVDTGLKVM
jgi:hypothetical protein